MSIISIPTPFNIDIEFEIAAFHKRLLAYLIDFTLLIVYLFAIAHLLQISIRYAQSTQGFRILVILLPLLLYSPLCELLWNGQSVGKKLLSIKVVSLDGAVPTLGQVLLRWFLRFYEWGFIIFTIFWGSGLAGFGFLMVGGICSIIFITVTPNSQRLGDIVAGTVVVSTSSNLTVQDTIFMQVQPTGYRVQFPEVMKLSDRDINTIKNVLTQAKKTNNFEMCNRVAFKVQEVLQIPSNMYAFEFLEKMLEDYNYLAAKE